jgi:transcriptional regulator with XRE-family HTH domain
VGIGGSEIGRKLRQIRQARGKSLAVVAGLAGISTGYLSRLEHGERALDRRSLIVKLAEALEVAPTELTDLAVATPGDAVSAMPVDAVRIALLTAAMEPSRGHLVDIDVLRARVAALLDDQQYCRHEAVGARLPDLIADVHATAASGRQDGEAYRLLALLHVQGTQAWLRDVGAPLDLGWQAATQARAAAELVDEPISLGIAAFGTAHGLLAAGAFDLAFSRLRSVDLALDSPASEQLTGMLVFSESLVAAAAGRPGDVSAALAQSDELAEHTGEGNELWFGFGPTNVAVWRMACALEAGDHAQAAQVAETVHPELIPSPQRQAAYWADYGRALARLRGRVPDAVAALRRAEQISPARIRHHPFARETVSELLMRSRRDSLGRELRGMAYRAGLHV